MPSSTFSRHIDVFKSVPVISMPTDREIMIFYWDLRSLHLSSAFLSCSERFAFWTSGPLHALSSLQRSTRYLLPHAILQSPHDGKGNGPQSCMRDVMLACYVTGQLLCNSVMLFCISSRVPGSQMPIRTNSLSQIGSNGAKALLKCTEYRRISCSLCFQPLH